MFSICLSICSIVRLSVCLSVRCFCLSSFCLSVCFPICLSVSLLYVYRSICLSVCSSICLPVSLCVCPSFCMSVPLRMLLVPLRLLLPPELPLRCLATSRIVAVAPCLRRWLILLLFVSSGNTRVPAQRRVRKVRSLADCPSLRLSSVHLHYLSSSSPVLYTSAKEYVPVSVCLFLFTYVCRSVSLSVPRSRSVCLFLYAYICPSYVRLSVCMCPCACSLSHYACALTGMQLLPFSGLTRAASTEKQHIYSQRCNCSDCVLCPVITERI